MAKYAIRTGEMNRIMELLSRVLDLRVTFFDLLEEEVDSFSIKSMSDFCRLNRLDAGFNSRCEECDRKHLVEAKRLGEVHVYHCHAGLLEGIVPLCNRRGVYLGAIVFGQLQDSAAPVSPAVSPERERLRRVSAGEMRDIGNLLKYLSEYICENELIRRCAKPWSVRLEEYVNRHLDEAVTLEKLAGELNKSVSFLSHNIPAEFGVPLKTFCRRRRMERACELLAAGKRVSECAAELGYYDAFYFSKEFRRVYQISPREWKGKCGT